MVCDLDGRYKRVSARIDLVAVTVDLALWTEFSASHLSGPFTTEMDVSNIPFRASKTPRSRMVVAVDFGGYKAWLDAITRRS